MYLLTTAIILLVSIILLNTLFFLWCNFEIVMAVLLSYFVIMPGCTLYEMNLKPYGTEARIFVYN